MTLAPKPVTIDVTVYQLPATAAENAKPCKCGHSYGAHAGGDRDYRNGSMWACYAGECACKIFERVK